MRGNSMKHKHHEQKHVQDHPDKSHVHHDGARRMRHNESATRARRDERRGEDAHLRRERKDKRDERKGATKGKEKRDRAQKAYERAVKTSKPGEGKRFKTLSEKIAVDYEQKGKSPAEAKRIAGATAAAIGRRKYGGKKMGKWSARGRK